MADEKTEVQHWDSARARARQVVALRSVGTGTFWVAMGAAASQGATLVANVLVANGLGPKAFGAYAFLQSTQNALGLLAQLSFGLAATRHLPEWRSAAPERASRLLGFGTAFSICTGVVAALALLAFTGALGARLDLPAPEALRCVAGAAVAVPLLALVLFQTGAVLGFEAFRGYAIVSAVTAVFAVALPVVGAKLHGVEGAILGLCLVALVRAVAGRQLLAAQARAHGVRPLYAGSDGALLRPFFDFAVPGFLTAIMATAALWAVGWLVLHHEGAAQFGLYAVTVTIRQIVLFVPVQLASVSLALMSREGGQAAHGRDIFKASLLLTVTVAGAIALVIGLAADAVLGLFGPGFVHGRTLLQLMLLSAVFEAAAISAYQVLPVRGLMWKSLKWVGLPRDLALLLCAWITVPQSGVYGGAAALLIGQIVALIGICLAVRARG